MDIVRTGKRKKRTPIYVATGIIVVVGITVGLSRMKPAPPSVDAGGIFPDTVRRGNMMIHVRGPGTLVPENIRWISSVTAGRVERVAAYPGDKVQPGTPLLVLTNPDVQLAALQSQRQLSDAQSQLVSLTSNLHSQRLAQQGTVATMQSQYNDAARQAKLQEELAAKGLGAANEANRVRDQLAELKQRLDIEKQRLEVLNGSIEEQINQQKLQIEQLRKIVQFNQEQIASMNVISQSAGVLQQLDLEVGQWVQPGTLLARVEEPGRLKAELRIPEVQAPLVVLGQNVDVDTRNGIIPGTVIRIEPSSTNGTVGVEVRLNGSIPAAARAGLSVDGTIEIERLNNVVYVGRPAYGQPESTVGLFKLEPGGKTAVRVNVKLGRASVNSIQVVQGLKEGDIVILSDMSAYDAFERVRLK